MKKHVKMYALPVVDTEDNWNLHNPVIPSGLTVDVITTNGSIRHKRGNGALKYSELNFDDENILKVQGLLNHKVIVPVGTTYTYGDKNDYVEDANLPRSLGAKKSYTIDSPFGDKPCIVIPVIKRDNIWRTQAAHASGSYDYGIQTSCIGDGKIHITTGNYLTRASGGAGVVAPLPTTTNTQASGEVVFHVWCSADSSSVISDMDLADERIIGTIGEKNLYERMFNVATPNSTSTAYTLIDLTDTAEEIISWRGILTRRSDGLKIPIDYFDGGGARMNSVCENKAIKLSFTNNFVNSDIRLFVQYTKPNE